MDFELKKAVEEKKQVFGWASVAKDKDGNIITDRQGDVIDIEDLESPVYDYVLKFGDSGEEHNPFLRKKAKIIESVVFTKQKTQAMGIPDGIVPEGWWIGVQIFDDDVWKKVKNGVYKMFSIEGKAKRVPMTKSSAKTFNEVYKGI